jgi:hypothetical protein
MDRTVVCGTIDPGSIPGGCTILINYLSSHLFICGTIFLVVYFFKENMLEEASVDYFTESINKAAERGVVVGADVITNQRAKDMGMDWSGKIELIDSNSGIAKLDSGHQINIDHLVVGEGEAEAEEDSIEKSIRLAAERGVVVGVDAISTTEAKNAKMDFGGRVLKIDILTGWATIFPDQRVHVDHLEGVKSK